MWYRAAADNESKTSREMTSRGRRHLAGWLLVSWAMFWLVSVIQLCCQTVPAPGDAADPWAAIQISSDETETGNPYGSAPQHEGPCQNLSVAAIDPSDTASAATYRAVLSFDTAPAATAPAPHHAAAVVAYVSSAPPLSGAPPYLRHQRLLI